MKILQRVLAATEAYPSRSCDRTLREADAPQEEPVACQLAERVGAKAIITPVKNHRMAAAIARFRPAMPIVALTASLALCRSLVKVWGVSPVEALADDDEPTRARRAGGWLFTNGLARAGDRAVSSPAHLRAAKRLTRCAS